MTSEQQEQVNRAAEELTRASQGWASLLQSRSQEHNDEQDQANGAAEELTEAARASSIAVADRAVSAQEHNVELAQSFFRNTIDHLHAQAEGNRQMSRQLVEQKQRGVEAVQVLAQKSVGTYMQFVESIFSFYRGGVDGAKRGERSSRQ